MALGAVFRASLAPTGPEWVSLEGTRKHVRAALPSSTRSGLPTRRTDRSDFEDAGRTLPADPEGSFLETELQALLAEFDGEVEVDESGHPRYRFPSIYSQFKGAETMRRRRRFEEQRVGDIVYSSDQSDEDAHDRDLALFDEELEGSVDLSRYLQSPERAGFLDDFEMVLSDPEGSGARLA
jgi:hypothetical protein